MGQQQVKSMWATAKFSQQQKKKNMWATVLPVVDIVAITSELTLISSYYVVHII